MEVKQSAIKGNLTSLSNVKDLFSLGFQGPKLFNSRSTEIQNASSIAVFTSKFRSSCLVQYKYF